MKRDHIVAFDHLRVISCLLVLLIHSSAQYTDGAAAQGGVNLYVSLGCNMLAFTSLALFVMISGALYLSPERGASFRSSQGAGGRRSAPVRKMVRRSIHFLLLYAFWKLFYLLEDCVIHPDLLAAEGFKKHVVLAFFQLPGKYHLWYLPMLAFLLLLVPLLYEGCQNRRACELYLLLFAVLTIIPQTAFNFEFPFKYLLMDFLNLFDLSYFGGYLGYFILGHYLYEYFCRPAVEEAGTSGKPIRKGRTMTSGWLILLWVSAVITWLVGLRYAAGRSVSDGTTFYGLSSPLMLHCLLFAAAIFLTVCQSCPGIGQVPSIVRILSRTSFGIYLLHPFALDLVKKAQVLPAMLWNAPAPGILILVVILGVISFLLSWALLHIPGVRKLVS